MLLTQLLDMIREWRFWKHKRRRADAASRRRTLSLTDMLTAAAQLAAQASTAPPPPGDSTSTTSSASSSQENTSTTHNNLENTGHHTGSRTAYLDLAVNADNLWRVEEELQTMQKTVAMLLKKMRHEPDELATCSDDECVGCVSGRACMQTFPCGHRVLCRKCFIRTIQVAVNDRNLPLRCVICRSKVVRLKCQSNGMRHHRVPCVTASNDVTLFPNATTVYCGHMPQRPPGVVNSQHPPSSQPHSGILQPAYL